MTINLIQRYVIICIHIQFSLSQSQDVQLDSIPSEDKK